MFQVYQFFHYSHTQIFPKQHCLPINLHPVSYSFHPPSPEPRPTNLTDQFPSCLVPAGSHSVSWWQRHGWSQFPWQTFLVSPRQHISCHVQANRKLFFPFLPTQLDRTCMLSPTVSIHFNSKILTLTRGTPPRTLSHSPPSLSSSSSSRRLDFLSCFFLALSSRFFSAAFLSSSVAGTLLEDTGEDESQAPSALLRLLPPVNFFPSSKS